MAAPTTAPPVEAAATFPGPRPGLAGPVAPLTFGMDAHAVWEALPTFRDAISLRLPPAAFDAFAAGHHVGDDVSAGGNRWVQSKSRQCRKLEADGAKWCVEVDERGLTRVRVDYPADAEPALTAAWGRAPLAGRWSIWLDREAGVRVADTGCFEEGAGNVCSVELMAYRPVGEVVAAAVKPGTLGAPRSTFPPGVPSDDDVERYTLPAYEVSSGFVPVELRVRDGVVVGWRTRLDWTYFAPFERRVDAALLAALGPATGQDEAGCRTWTTPPGKACVENTTVLVVVGDWPE